MSSPIHALLIDASPPIYDAVSAALCRSGRLFNLVPIKDLAELDQSLESDDVDCIICALHARSDFSTLSQPVGHSILRHVRSHPNSLPVVMLLDADDEENYAAEAIRLGAEDYVVTTSMQRLPQTLSSAVHHRRLLEYRDNTKLGYKQVLTALRGSDDGICITDREARIILANDAFCHISGYHQSELRGQNPRILKSGQHDENFYRNIWTALREKGCWQDRVINRHKDGSHYEGWLRISAVHDEQGRVSHYIGQLGYISEQRQLIERLNNLTRFDPLTGLPNRSLFLDRLEQSMVVARRSHRSVAVALIHLDRFRLINDTLGQTIGDQVLIDMARSFSKQIRQGDTVARLSGNEFSFLLGNLDTADDALNLTSRLQAAIAQPLEYNGHPLTISASIGIAVSPKDGNTSHELLKAADTALVRAKLSGGNCFSFYSSSMDADARRRQAIEIELRQALNNNEFHLLYQPQNNLDSGNIIGTEALLRWNNPTLGMVSPAEFIPIAEESGLIIAIGSWVLRQACIQNKEWQDLGLPRIRVAVNASTRQFRGGHLAGEVASVLAETGLPPDYLEIEITESALINDIEAAIATSRELKALGVKLSLDDFGTGYSSLAYVSRFPFDKLKIDQSFVHDITHNPANAAIAAAAIAIARGLNLSVLAEGVETEAQALFLRSRHCNAMQGYLFRRPLPPHAVAQLLAENVRLHLSSIAVNNDQTLLIVDDEPSILSAMTRLFRHENYRILTTTRVTDAFELLARHPIQVIISDQRMAEMTGTEFFARVRQIYPHTQRIILSGYTELEAVMDAVNRGAVYKFLTKPWDDDLLREQVREAFRIAAQPTRTGQAS